MLRGQQTRLDAQRIEPACPVVGRAARFHDNQTDFTIGKPALELGTGQAMSLDNAPGRIGHGELEDGLCKINGNGSSMHFGLLSIMKT